MKKNLPNPRQKLGRTGEDLAAAHLLRQGYRIIDRNFRARYGELDIIALRDGMLVFVEVKTRGDASFGTALEAVTPRKLAEVVRTAQYYKVLHEDLPGAMRIDVIAIDFTDGGKPKLSHIRNVTQ